MMLVETLEAVAAKVTEHERSDVVTCGTTEARDSTKDRNAHV